MRIFPKIHPRISKLIKYLNLEIIDIPYKTPYNLFCGRNKLFYNNKLFPNTNICYNINDYEKNIDTFDYINIIIEYILQKYNIKNIESVVDYNERKKMYSNEYLCKLGFKQELLNINNKYYLSNENYNRFKDISGYSNMLNNISFLASFYEASSINNHPTQYFIKKGMNQIIKKLIKNHEILFNTEFTKFIDKNNIIECYLKNIITNTNTKIFCKKLFITVPSNNVHNIIGFNPSFYKLYSKSLSEISLFKIFFYYDQNWWIQHGFKNGRCTTDLPFNQLWFYDNNTLLLYSVGDDAKSWLSILPYEKQISFIDIKNNNLTNITTQLLNFIKIMFKNFTNYIPLPNKICWNFYRDGKNMWNPNNNNILNIQKNLIYNSKNIYYLNNDISLNQGWVEGSLEIVDDFLLTSTLL